MTEKDKLISIIQIEIDNCKMRRRDIEEQLNNIDGQLKGLILALEKIERNLK